MNLPNKLTMLRILLIPVFMVFVELDSLPGHMLWAFAVFVAASLTDMIDGKIARKYNLITDFGKFMDPLADKILVTAALVYFIPLGLAPAWVVILILAREFLVTSLRLIAAGKGIVIAADRWGKYKTATTMVWIAYALLMQHFWSGVPGGLGAARRTDGAVAGPDAAFGRKLSVEEPRAHRAGKMSLQFIFECGKLLKIESAKMR